MLEANVGNGKRSGAVTAEAGSPAVTFTLGSDGGLTTPTRPPRSGGDD